MQAVEGVGAVDTIKIRLDAVIQSPDSFYPSEGPRLYPGL